MFECQIMNSLNFDENDVLPQDSDDLGCFERSLVPTFVTIVPL